EVHLIAVDREDLFLRVALLDLNGENPLPDLPLEGLLLAETELILQIARELLGQRAGSLRPTPLDDVDECGRGDAPDVDAEVAVELSILGCDDRLAKRRVDVLVPDDHAALGRELADHLT